MPEPIAQEIRMTIILRNGRITVEGPMINDKLLSYALLQGARDAIYENKPGAIAIPT